MPRDIKESDWKAFKQIHSMAYDRFCERIMAEVRRIVEDETKAPHDRFIAIDVLLHRRKKQSSNAFADFRRSTAFLQLGTMYSYGLVQDEELSRFSPEMQDGIKSLYEKRGLE